MNPIMLKEIFRQKTKHITVLPLNKCLFTVIIFLLQLYLIISGLKRAQDTIAAVLPSSTSMSTIYFTIFLIIISIILTVLCLVCGLLRINNYSHDGLEFGKDLDKPILIKPKKDSKFVQIWRRLPPIYNLSHILSAICLLYSDLLIDYIRIENNIKPLGDIFKTKFDFLVGEPIDRIHNQKLLKHTDDFSVTIKNCISLDMLNYCIALTTFSVQIAQNFWYTNKKFCVLIFYLALNYTVISIISYFTFEITFKIDIFPIKYQLYSNVYLSLIYFVSLSIKFISVCLYVHHGYIEYEKSKEIFEKSLMKFLPTTAPTTTTTPALSATTMPNETIQSVLFKKNIFLIILFLLFCLLRTLYLIEIFIIYKNLADKIILISFTVEIICVLFWLLLLCLFLIENKWSFKLSMPYKLTNWKYFNDFYVKKAAIGDGKPKMATHFTASNEHLYVRDDSLLNQSIDEASSDSSNQKQTTVSTISGDVKCYEELYSKPKRILQQQQHIDLTNTEPVLLRTAINENSFLQRTYSHRMPKALSFDVTTATTLRTEAVDGATAKKFNYASVCVRSQHQKQTINDVFNRHASYTKRHLANRNTIFVDSPSISATDSGRDSLNESPISNKQLTSNNTSINSSNSKEQQLNGCALKLPHLLNSRC